MEVRSLPILLLVLLTLVSFSQSLDDLIAEESQTQQRITRRTSNENATEPIKKYSSKIRSSDEIFGLKTSPKKSVLDFRIEPEGLKAAAAGNGNTKSKEDDDEEKTLAQQVADGKYGLIQNEIFPNGSKRPGVISYLPNPEVPKDTKEDYGGLDKDEIWLAEDHVLVLRGGRYPTHYNETAPTPWAPIDDYIAPPRQVEIPKNPKIPPPFPIQLTEDGPLEIIRGVNGSLPPRPPFFPPFPLPGPGDNNTFPFPVPPGPLPPFLANLPPGAAFLPPPGNASEIDEDDPSIFYPPRYDFYYPQDNTTAVPPGPLVPGIILPPPPNFFSPEKEDTPNEEENETDPEDNPTTKPPYIAPAYLPTNRKPPRPYTKRPPTEKKTSTVTYIFPEKPRPRTSRPPLFTSPIYVPNMVHRTPYFPSTTPRPHHITIPRNRTLKQDIFIITTEPPESDNSIVNLLKDIKPTTGTLLEEISPEKHPLRSLLKPNVSVNYIGKVGHLPPSTAFPFPKTEHSTTEVYPTPGTGHFITFPPSVTVTPVPIVKKIKVRPSETATQNPHATFYFYEEPHSTPLTHADENEVSVSPIDQYLKENFKHEGPDVYVKPAKSPVYIPKKTRTKTRPTYTPQEDPPKLNTLEIDNSGFSGLSFTPTTENPSGSLRVRVTPSSFVNNPTTDSPFIPSNYYATANPASIHFTGIDTSVVDDITMKYFTIFGQKLHAGGTTPLTPPPPTSTPARQYKPKLVQFTTTESPKSYITVTTPQPRPIAQSYIHMTAPKPKPPSHFEQYLQEITGEDQKDFVITHNGASPPKLKKPKASPGFNDNSNIYQQQKYYLPYGTSDVSQYLKNIYRPTSSPTHRPVTDINLQPQYIQQISTTYRPYVNPQQRPKPLDHNFGQYLQEVTYHGPKNPNPSSSNLQYFDASTVRQQYHKRPVSLESDILVNYRQPLPGINPDSEQIQAPYSSSNSNIKVVNAPNLSPGRGPYRQVYQPQPHHRGRIQQSYDPAKNFFENLPHSGYFNPPPSSNTANAFVSYNLPGNGGHFYFLTPQAADRSDSYDDEEDEQSYAVKRSNDGDRGSQRRGRRPSQSSEHRGNSGHTSQDFLRRRRKKP